MVVKGYAFTKTSRIASIGAIFTSTFHTKQLNPWPNSSASCVVNYSRLSACQGDMQPFEGDPSTCGRLASLRKNKPQQNQPGQLSASILQCLNCKSMCTAQYRLMVKSMSCCCVHGRRLFSNLVTNFTARQVNRIYAIAVCSLLLHGCKDNSLIEMY